MNVNEARSIISNLMKGIGTAIAIIAVAKLFGVQIPIRASLIELAAVAIACAHA